MTLQRIGARSALPLFNAGSTRMLEQTLAERLPPHTLMQRAGQSLARMALAVAPHARMIWIACGPGNNGGDGLEAARILHLAGHRVCVSHWPGQRPAPLDAQAALQRAQAACIEFVSQPPELGAQDVIIDGLLGLGAQRAVSGQCADWVRHMNRSPATVLATDLPTGLNPISGQVLLDEQGTPGPVVLADHTLMLLTAKPGLFMGAGRDASGQLWLDDLTRDAAEHAVWTQSTVHSQLNPPPAVAPQRAHQTHKGSYGDVAIVGGESLHERGMGMTGAALLAASAALHGGAGRVLVSLLASTHTPWPIETQTAQPEWMFRTFEALDLAQLTVVCGCGGGLAVRRVLAEVLQRSQQLVLDADALNALALDSGLSRLLKNRSARALPTVLTPHPLEAARLLGCSTLDVQNDRVGSAQALATQWGCTVVLKGSGTVIACPGQLSRVNPTGNARLATAGTGDVLAGWIGAKMAQGQGSTQAAFEAASQAVYQHGQVADTWASQTSLTASALAQHVH